MTSNSNHVLYEERASKSKISVKTQDWPCYDSI